MFGKGYFYWFFGIVSLALAAGLGSEGAVGHFIKTAAIAQAFITAGIYQNRRYIEGSITYKDFYQLKKPGWRIFAVLWLEIAIGFALEKNILYFAFYFVLALVFGYVWKKAQSAHCQELDALAQLKMDELISAKAAEERRQAEAEAQKAENYTRFLHTKETLPRFSIDTTKPQFAPLTRVTELPNFRFSTLRGKAGASAFSTYVSLDVETTGLSAAQNEIVQVAAVLFEEFSPVEAFVTYVRPLNGLTDEAQAVNGITEEMVADAPTIAEVLPSLVDFIGNAPIVGYNLAFDLKFLCMAGFPLRDKTKLFDLYALIPTVFKREEFPLENYKLETVVAHTNIGMDSAHDALSDALATGMLMELAVDKLL